MTQHKKSGFGRRSFIAGTALVAAAATTRPSLGEAGGSAKGQPHFAAHSDDLEWFATVPGETMSILVPNERAGGRYSVVESIAEPGAAAPPHIHRSTDEYFFIQEGTMHYVCDGLEFDAREGSSVFIPRGVAHSWINLGDSPVRSLVSFTPGGMERMFEEIAAVFPDGIDALSARFDTILAG